MNCILYDTVIRVRTRGVFGESEEMLPFAELVATAAPIVSAWLDDDDCQEMTLCSSNIGVVKTYRKFYRRNQPRPPKPRPGLAR